MNPCDYAEMWRRWWQRMVVAVVIRVATYAEVTVAEEVVLRKSSCRSGGVNVGIALHNPAWHGME